MANEVDSASDDRIENNSVRHQYRVLSEAEKRLMVEIKDIGAAFIAKCREIPSASINRPAEWNRGEIGNAMVRMEEAVMWAVKGLTK